MSHKPGSRPMTGRDFGFGVLLILVGSLVGAAMWLSGSFEWLLGQLSVMIDHVRDFF